MAEEFAEIWRFGDCPEDWQDLSQNGGDEDWIVVVNDHDPYGSAEDLAAYLDSMKQPQNVTLPDGREAWICSHA
jgi:hypothetical protein